MPVYGARSIETASTYSSPFIPTEIPFANYCRVRDGWLVWVEGCTVCFRNSFALRIRAAPNVDKKIHYAFQLCLNGKLKFHREIKS